MTNNEKLEAIKTATGMSYTALCRLIYPDITAHKQRIYQLRNNERPYPAGWEDELKRKIKTDIPDCFKN